MANTVSSADIDRAHAVSSRHKEQIERSDQCGCFYCQKTFAPSTIREWWDDGQTAVCPHCGIDSVLGSASGFPLTTEFLAQMHQRWFT